MSKPDERLLEEIGRALRDMFESEASRNSTDLPLRAEAFPYWKKRAQELLELRILVPREQADAAVAAFKKQVLDELGGLDGMVEARDRIAKMPANRSALDAERQRAVVARLAPIREQLAEIEEETGDEVEHSEELWRLLKI